MFIIKTIKNLLDIIAAFEEKVCFSINLLSHNGIDKFTELHEFFSKIAAFSNVEYFIVYYFHFDLVLANSVKKNKLS